MVQEKDVRISSLGLRRQEAEARHEEEQRWLDTYFQTEMDEIVARVEQVNDEHCNAEGHMLAEQLVEQEELLCVEQLEQFRLDHEEELRVEERQRQQHAAELLPEGDEPRLSAEEQRRQSCRLRALESDAATSTGAADDASSEKRNEALQCPISFDTMVDPIVASDGHTYDRFSAFLIIDSGANMPCCPLGTFAIFGEMLPRFLVR